MPRIEAFEFGCVLVEGEEHRRDVIVLPKRVVRGWSRRDGRALVPDDLEEVLEELPERLVVGIRDSASTAGGQPLTVEPSPDTREDIKARMCSHWPRPARGERPDMGWVPATIPRPAAPNQLTSTPLDPSRDPRKRDPRRCATRSRPSGCTTC